MSHPLEKLLTAYLTQQEEAGIPLYLTGERHTAVKPEPIKLTLPGIPDRAPIVRTSAPASAVESVQPRSAETAVPVRTHDMIRAELADLYRRGKECTACTELSHNRTKVVFGAGNASAKIMIIGEAPGYDEDQTGLPFVGAAGQLLNKMLAAVSIDRDKETFVSNVVKCRPPGNRTPSTQECLTCLPILKRQIAIVRPKILLLLGKTAASAVLDSTASISAIHGKEFSYHGIPAFVTYHPAALLRDSSLKRSAWEDLQIFQKRCRELINE